MPGKMFSTMPNDFEVIRKDLFSLEFPVQMQIPEQFIVSGARPNISNPRRDIQYKNLTFYYKGKTNNEELTYEFRDAIGLSVYQKLDQWQREHTDQATGKGGYAATYKKTLILNIEDPTGAVVQQYFLFGCFITNLNGGDLSMEDDGIANVSMTLSYDTYARNF